MLKVSVALVANLRFAPLLPAVEATKRYVSVLMQTWRARHVSSPVMGATAIKRLIGPEAVQSRLLAPLTSAAK